VVAQVATRTETGQPGDRRSLSESAQGVVVNRFRPVGQLFVERFRP
jgi:hypothetical protein